MTCHAGRPQTVWLGGRELSVARILDLWLVEDDWWRLPLARRYVWLLLTGGRMLTLFEDRINGGWYLQRYRLPVDHA